MWGTPKCTGMVVKEWLLQGGVGNFLVHGGPYDKNMIVCKYYMVCPVLAKLKTNCCQNGQTEFINFSHTRSWTLEEGTASLSTCAKKINLDFVPEDEV